jgi:hypothetical protein
MRLRDEGHKRGGKIGRRGGGERGMRGERMRRMMQYNPQLEEEE